MEVFTPPFTPDMPSMSGSSTFSYSQVLEPDMDRCSNRTCHVRFELLTPFYYLRNASPRPAAVQQAHNVHLLNHVDFARRSTPQQATCQTEGLWPLPPLSTVDPISLFRGSLATSVTR